MYGDALEITSEQATKMQFAWSHLKDAETALAALHIATRYSGSFAVAAHGFEFQVKDARQSIARALRLLDEAEASILGRDNTTDGTIECNGCGDRYETKFYDACPDCAPDLAPAVNEDARQVRDDYARAVGAPR